MNQWGGSRQSFVDSSNYRIFMEFISYEEKKNVSEMKDEKFKEKCTKWINQLSKEWKLI